MLFYYLVLHILTFFMHIPISSLLCCIYSLVLVRYYAVSGFRFLHTKLETKKRGNDFFAPILRIAQLFLDVSQQDAARKNTSLVCLREADDNG